MIEYTNQIVFGQDGNRITLTGRRRILPVNQQTARLLVASGIGAWDGDCVYYCGAARAHLLDNRKLDVPADGMLDIDISELRNPSAFAVVSLAPTDISHGPAK